MPHEETEDDLTRKLEENGWQESGGGDNFLSLTKEGRTIYVFEGQQGMRRGPYTSHWVEVDSAESILRGGFTVASLDVLFE